MKGKDLKQKILLLASGRLDYSGVPSVMLTLVRRLSDEYCFDLLLNAENTGPGPFDEEFLSYGGQIFRCQKRRFRFRPVDRAAELLRPHRLYAVTRRLLKADHYHAIHCHNEFDMAGPLAAAKRYGVPIRLAETHKTWERGSRGVFTRLWRALCRRSICRSATGFLGCSEQANTAFFGADHPCVTVAAPYDEIRFVYPAVQPPPERLWLVQIGYFCENKNQIFTVEIFYHLASRVPGARLFLAGSDQDGCRARLLSVIREKGLEDRVSLLPPNTDLPALLAESTLLLLPSRAEGFGIVLIEAQAMGLSCYASDAVPRETDRGGVTFLPLSAGPEAWAETILSERRYTHRTPYDCRPFSAAAFAERFRVLYRSEQKEEALHV